MALQCFHFGAWYVNPGKQSLSDGRQERHLEPRAMDVLVTLCRRPRTVLSAEELLEQCWETTLYGDNPVHKVIARLRRELGDDPVTPSYIETIRKRGYRTCAEVRFLTGANVAQSSFLHASPFCGLLPFDEAHAPVFFGRNDAIYRLRRLIGEQLQRPQAVEMILLLGASGSGKTSLVRAGLLPSLQQEQSVASTHATPHPVRLCSHAGFDLAEKGELSLMQVLALLLLRLDMLPGTRTGTPDAEVREWAQKLTQDPDAVLAQARPPDPGHAPTQAERKVLFIDRFEAIFDERTIAGSERNGFLLTLDRLARSRRVLVLLACRNDFYPQIAATPLLMECKLRGTHFDLGPPSQAEIAQMIRLPALAANLRYEVNPQSNLGLDEILCESALGNPDALPLLQYTLHELYRMKSGDGELGFAAYEQLGGIEGAIGQRAEQLVAQWSPGQVQCLPRIWSLVVTLSQQQPEIRSRHASWAALGDQDERDVVRALVESRLFVSEFNGGVAGFGVAHEALLRRWPRLMEWIDSHRQALQIRARIGEQAQRWDFESRNAELLVPRGRQLEEALALARLSTFSLSALELDYIAASQNRSRRRRDLRIGALASVMVLSILIFALGLSALADQRRANVQQASGEALTGFMLGDITDQLRPIGRLDLLDSVGAKALDYFSTSSDQDLNAVGLSHRAKALQVLAEVRIDRHDAKAAVEALQTSDAILKKILDQALRRPPMGDSLLMNQSLFRRPSGSVTSGSQPPVTHFVLKTMGENARLRGQIASGRDDWPLANQFFRQYLQLAQQQLQLLPSDREGLIAQSDAYLNLGMVAIYQRHYAVADQAFSDSIRITHLLLAKNEGARLQKAELADSYSWSGYSREQQGQFEAAMAFYEKEAAIVAELHEENPSEILWASRWALSLQNQVGLHLALGNDEAAVSISRQSEQIYRKVLAGDASNNARMLDMIMIQMRTQRILARRGMPLPTLLALQELQKITQKMVQTPATRGAWERVDAQLQLRIGVCLTRLQQGPLGKQKILEAQQRLEAMLLATPSNFQARVTLLEALLARADLEQNAGNPEAARSSCERGVMLTRELAQNSVEHRVLDPWLRLNLCLHRFDVARQVQQKLYSIGYRDTLLLQHISAAGLLPGMVSAQK